MLYSLRAENVKYQKSAYQQCGYLGNISAYLWGAKSDCSLASSYKTHNCLNIQKIFDNLGNANISRSL